MATTGCAGSTRAGDRPISPILEARGSSSPGEMNFDRTTIGRDAAIRRDRARHASLAAGPARVPRAAVRPLTDAMSALFPVGDADGRRRPMAGRVRVTGAGRAPGPADDAMATRRRRPVHRPPADRMAAMAAAAETLGCAARAAGGIAEAGQWTDFCGSAGAARRGTRAPRRDRAHDANEAVNGFPPAASRAKRTGSRAARARRTRITTSGEHR